MKTMITGVRPTGSITLANYIGGIKGFVEQQYKYNSLIFIADIHGLTTYIDPKEIRNNILDITAMYMACGIDINNTALFMQSDVLEHCNLNDTVIISKKAASTGGSRLGLKLNDKITVTDLLYGLLLYIALVANVCRICVTIKITYRKD